MTFKYPTMLWAFVAVPVVLIAYFSWQRRRVTYHRAWASDAMAPNVMPRAAGQRRHVPPLLYLLGLVSLLVALARPEAALALQREEGTVVVVMDSSNSMLAEDIVPNRLEAGRRAAIRLLVGLPGKFRVGVVAFSGRAQILSRPTVDRAAVERALDGIGTASGTAIGEGLAKALTMVPETPPNEGPPLAVVLLSDGNNTTGARGPLEIARTAGRLNIPIHAVTLGDPGAPAAARGEPRPPSERTLEAIARLTAGRLFSATSSGDLEQIYADIGTTVSTARELQEITVVFVGAAAALLLAAAGISVIWFRRVP